MFLYHLSCQQVLFIFVFMMSNQEHFPNHWLKQFLQDIKAYGGIAQQTYYTNLTGLCDCNPQVDGAKGSQLHRQVQKRYAKLCKLLINKYNKLVEAYGVQPLSSCSFSQHCTPLSSPDSISSEESFHFLLPPKLHAMSHHQLVMKSLWPYSGKPVYLLLTNLLCFLITVLFRWYGLCSKLCH